MRGNTVSIAHSVEIVTEECYSCGVLFGMTAYQRRQLLQNHRNFYCPNGHAQNYVGETDAQKAQRLLAEERKRHEATLARLNEAESLRAAADLALQQSRKRHAAAVCPCCKRTFKQLSRHMQTKHPEYKP